MHPSQQRVALYPCEKQCEQGGANMYLNWERFFHWVVPIQWVASSEKLNSR